MNEPIVTDSELELERIGAAVAKTLNLGDIVFLEVFVKVLTTFEQLLDCVRAL